MLNVSKSRFGVSELDFLGHHVDATGICPLENKVKIIQEFPRPDTQCKLQRFLRLANFYHRFIPHGATIFQPLHSLLRCTKRSSDPLPWADDISAFDNIKQALADAILLVHPVLNSSPVLHTGTTSVVDFQELVLAQADDPELSQLQLDSLLQLQSVPFPSEGTSLICDTFTGVQRPYVPQCFRRTIFEALHSI